MVKVSCKFCKSRIECKKWAGHIKGKKHAKNLPLKVMVECDVKNQIEKVDAYFSQFGEIFRKNVTQTQDNTFLIEYQFRNREVYTTLAHRKHILFNKFVTLFWVKDEQRTEPITMSPKGKIRNENNTEAKLPTKTEVIELCERVIKMLSFPHLSLKQIRKPTTSRSPLSQPVKFNFNSRKKPSDIFRRKLLQVLQQVALLPEELDAGELMNSVAESLCEGVTIDRLMTKKILLISLLRVE